MDSYSRQCEECNTNLATAFCVECEERLCNYCDELIHRGGKRKSHKRQHSCQCRGLASSLCTTCSLYLCDSCAYLHQHSSIKKIQTSKFVVVFWDTTQNKISDQEAKQFFESLSRSHPNISEIKVYGDSLSRQSAELATCPITFSKPEGIQDSEAILLDISLCMKDSISEILLIFPKAPKYKVHFNQIQSGMPGVKLLISTSFPFLNFMQVKDLHSEARSPPANSKSSAAPSWETQLSLGKYHDLIPVYHSFPRQPGQSHLHDLVLSLLKELAKGGQIMNDAGWLCKTFAQRGRLSMDRGRGLIKDLETLGLVHTMQRSFTDLKTMFFTCLKTESLSYESVVWALRSLKLDEMLPTERAVQSRIKEVFDYKVPASEWEVFMDLCKSQKTQAKSPQASYSLFSQSSASAHFSFDLKEIPDPVTKQRLVLVYPLGEEWDSKDQYIKEGDVLSVKETADWEAFVEFFSKYFEGTFPGDESKAIPGGRYGCAQFLKFCGNQALKDCSLGKLSYMIQLSIDEYLLRYYRTLLVWAPTHKSPNDKENSEKISLIQSKIIEILKESKEGLSLAQLPLFIKRKLNCSVHLGELGFAKLKDLLLTMQEVEIEIRGNNHPFAVFKSTKERKMEEEVKAAVERAVFQTVNGITSQKLEKILQETFGPSNHLSDLRGTALQEFISRRCPSISSLKTNKLTIFKRKEEKQTCIKTLQEKNLKTEGGFLGPDPFQSYFDPFTYCNPSWV